jgi:regulator of protease activity HflC (stomatin/prohibitin superfamily)
MRPSSAVSTLLLFLSWIGGAILGATMFLGTRDPVSAMLPMVGGLLLGWFLFASVKVVAQWERMIVLRLGKFHGVADPGVRLLIPILDSPLYVEMRVQAADIARQQAITQDNVPVVVNGVIFFKVADPESAALRVENYRVAMLRLAQATLRDVVGRLTLDELLSHQERLESEIARNVEVQSKSWGLHVEGIKLEDIDVPEELKKMMSRQASSEREKRATIIKAEGDRLAAGALAEAAATMAASPGAMQLRLLQTIDGLGPSASNTVVLALPMEVIDVQNQVRVEPDLASVGPCRSVPPTSRFASPDYPDWVACNGSMCFVITRTCQPSTRSKSSKESPVAQCRGLERVSEGRHPSSEGRHPSSEGRHPSSEGRYPSNGGRP